MPTGKGKKIENWTMTFEGKPIMTYEEAPFEETPPEYRDDWLDEEAQIKALKDRIDALKHKVSYLQGKCDAQETFWKISNSEG